MLTTAELIALVNEVLTTNGMKSITGAQANNLMTQLVQSAANKKDGDAIPRGGTQLDPRQAIYGDMEIVVSDADAEGRIFRLVDGSGAFVCGLIFGKDGSISLQTPGSGGTNTIIKSSPEGVSMTGDNFVFTIGHSGRGAAHMSFLGNQTVWSVPTGIQYLVNIFDPTYADPISGVPYNNAGNPRVLIDNQRLMDYVSAGGFGIGAPVTGGVANNILFVNSAGNVGQDANFTYNASTGMFNLSHSNYPVIRLNDTETSGRYWDLGSGLQFLGSFSVSNNVHAPFTLEDNGTVHLGATNKLVIDSNGNLIKLNNLTVSAPSVQGAANSILTNDGAGNWVWISSSSTVLSTLLTGFAAANATILATDTVLQGFNKAQGQISAIIASKGVALGIASLDSGGKVPVAQLPNTVMEYQGSWNAATNTPTLADGTGTNGMVYRTSTAGTQTFGGVSMLYNVGDLIIYNGSIWQHSPAADGVSSVNGLTGAVIVTGTVNRVIVGASTGVVDIAPTYGGQTSITTLGVITTGTLGAGAKVLLGADATGDIYYNAGAGALTRLGIGAAGTVLHGGVTPSYSAVSLTADVSGILPIANGGTNKSSFTSGSVVFFDGTRFQEDNTGLFYDFANHRVGIGTATPSKILDVISNANAIADVRFQNTNAGVTASSVVRINSDTGELALGVYSSVSTGTMAGLNKAKLKTIFDNSVAANSNGLLIGTADAVPLYFASNTIERMRIDANGYVGVNVGATNKLSLFNVIGASDSVLAATTTANASATITGVGTSFLSLLAIGDRISLSSAAGVFATITAIASDTSLTTSAVLGNGSSQTINLKKSIVNIKTAAGTSQLFISDAGLLSLGDTIFDATNPERFKIDAGATTSVNAMGIYGSINSYFQQNIKNSSTGTVASSDYVATTDTGSETSQYGNFGINNSLYADPTFTITAALDVYLYAQSNKLVIGTASAQDVVFFTGGTLAANERMRISGSTGYVGIGTSSPGSPLHVIDLTTTSNTGVFYDRYTSTNLGPRIWGRKANGTPAAPTAVTSSNNLVGLHGAGWDGSSYVESGRITFSVAGTVSTGVVPGSMAVFTANTSGLMTLAMSIAQDQSTILFGSLAVGNGGVIKKTLVATASLDFPNVAASSTQVLTISVPGAALSDAIALGIPDVARIAGLTYQADVSAAGTVTVSCTNGDTLAGHNPPAGTFNVVIFQI